MVPKATIAVTEVEAAIPQSSRSAWIMDESAAFLAAYRVSQTYALASFSVYNHEHIHCIDLAANYTVHWPELATEG